MSDFETIRLSCDTDGVAVLQLNRPEKHNALNAEMIAELRQAAAAIAEDARIRAVVLGGVGKSFCAGGDLTWMQAQAEKDRAGKIRESSELALMLRELDTLPKPVIGAVGGNAFGGGIGMMAVCDIVVAVGGAKFALTETKLGLIPATIGPYVVRRLGEGKARTVFMGGRVFDAEAGAKLGLIDEVTSPDDLAMTVRDYAENFLNCAPGAVADAKALCLDLARNQHDDTIAYTAGKLADRWETEEAQEGIAAFFAKKPNIWRGGTD